MFIMRPFEEEHKISEFVLETESNQSQAQVKILQTLPSSGARHLGVTEQRESS